MHETDIRDERYRRFVGRDYCYYVSVARRAQAEEMRRLLPIAAARLRALLGALRLRPRTRDEATPAPRVHAPLGAVR